MSKKIGFVSLVAAFFAAGKMEKYQVVVIKLSDCSM